MVNDMASGASNKNAGFTLVELAVVTAIMGIVMAVAVPSVRDMLANQRMKTASFNLITTAMIARSEAVKRGIPIYVKSLPGTGLQGGWCIMASSTPDCSLTAPDNATMHLQDALGGIIYSPTTGVTLTSGMALITFNRSGRLAVPARVEITDDVNSLMKRCVLIDVGGSARSSMGACP
jgi:type IV fimbrial biogenesis protein FimT